MLVSPAINVRLVTLTPMAPSFDIRFDECAWLSDGGFPASENQNPIA
jgi:hypothetical protein